jgi:hypothetical protein
MSKIGKIVTVSDSFEMAAILKIQNSKWRPLGDAHPLPPI